MAVVDKPRKKRIFIASSQPRVVEVDQAMEYFDLDSVTLEQSAPPGATWVESLYRCVNDADLVIGVMADRRKDTNVFFELGVASALNKPTLLFVAPDYPVDLIPPSGMPYLRMDFDQAAIDEAVGRMIRALQATYNSFGLVLFKEPRKISHAAPRSLPVAFVSAEEFVNGLRDMGQAKYVRSLRIAAAPGY